MQDENIKAPRQIERRTILKGAAWSAPVIAAAVAAPAYAASGDTKARLAMASGCIQVAGFSAFPGFSVRNTGTEAYSGTITVVETIDLSALKLDPNVPDFWKFNNQGLLSSAARLTLWAVLLVQGFAAGTSAGVTTGSWQPGTSASGVPLSYHRTVTINTTIAAGGKANWGVLFDVTKVLNALSAVGIGASIVKQTAQITSPTGNPPVVDAGPKALDFQLIGSC